LIEILKENIYDLIDIKTALDKSPSYAIRNIIENIFKQALEMMFRSPDGRIDDCIIKDLGEPITPIHDMN